MKLLSVFIIIFLFVSCNKVQPLKTKEIHFKKFNWTIDIPDDLEGVSREDWAKYQEKGTEAIENTIGTEVENNASIIFVFKKENSNYIESNFQPFDENLNGRHSETFDEVNNLIIETFEKNIPNLVYKKNRTTRTIDGLVFQELELTLYYPNDVVLKLYMFSRLFGKEELTINIIYTDEDFGRNMLNAFTSSKFH